MERKLFLKRQFSFVLFFVFMLLFCNSMCITEVKAASYVEGGVDISRALDDIFYMGIYQNEQLKLVYRYKEYTITDASQFLQSYDVINVTYWGETVDNLINSGYKTLVLVFRFDIKEVDDGYQEIYLYNYSSSLSMLLVSPIVNFEHGAGYKNTNYTTYEFYAEISLTDIIDNRIFVRYGANGYWADTWKNKNLAVQLGVSTETRVYTGLCWITNGV